MKTCSSCKINQSKTEYHRHLKYKDNLFPMCKSCRKVRVAAYQKKNKETIKNYKNKYNSDYTKWARSFKEGPCTDCKEQFHPAAMQWDHLPGKEKVIDLARVMTKKQFLEEVKKCELVCANCHSVRTYKRMKNEEKV